MNYDILIIGVVIVLLLAALFFIPQWRMKRSIPQVIRIFRRCNATSSKDAKTIDELGLRPRSLMQGMFRGRDYRPYALEALMRSGIVEMTEDRKLYLSEDKLINSGLERRTPSYR